LLGDGGLAQLLMQARRRANRAWLRKKECPENLTDECGALQTMLESALTSVIEANELARTGNADSINEAVKKYEEVNKLPYKILKVENPQKEAQQLADEGHRERAENYGQSDNWEKAINEYKQLKNWKLLFDASQMVASRGTYKNSTNTEVAFVSEAMDLHHLGKDAYKKEGVRDRKALAKHDNYICWYGSWWRNYNADLKEACEEISELDNDFAYADTQGVYFALASECTKDDNYRKKAIDSFRFYVSKTMNEENKVVRTDWIRMLENGDTIFTPKNVTNAVGKLTATQLEMIKKGRNCN
jgi:hypothetical protein